MKFIARIVTPDGKPIAVDVPAIVSAKGQQIFVVSEGKNDQGVITVITDVGSLWGLTVGGKPVISYPLTTDVDTINLGELVMLKEGLAWPSFHADASAKVYGLPRAVYAATQTAAVPTAVAPTLATTAGMSVGNLFGSTARQLGEVTAQSSAFTLSNASVKFRGVPTASGDALGLDFPDAALAASGQGLSEVAFSLKRRVDVTPLPPPVTSGPQVPNLLGYTRELALRKLATAGYVAEVSQEIVMDVAQSGRVIRQYPGASTALTAGGLVRLFIGKNLEG